MKIETINANNFAVKAGIILLILPTIIWIGLLSKIIFNASFLFTSIVQPIDEVSSILTFFIMVILPAMAILINVKSITQLKFLYSENNFILHLELQKSFVQWIIVLYGCLTIAAVLLYAFFENFKIIATHVF